MKEQHVMKKEYIAEYQHNYEPDVWRNAAPAYFSNNFGIMNRRYCSTLKEAQAALREVKEHFNGKPRTTTQHCGSIGISINTDSKLAKELMISKTRIRVRMVTEWETVAEK